MKNTSSNVKVKPLQSRAFTLIEMLVVIAIIALLTGIVLTSLTGSKSKARDVKRISDIGNIQVALALYYDRCKQYPPTPLNLADGSATGKCSSPNVKLSDYISTIPTSPSPGVYIYIIDGATPPSDFVLSATLENYNEILKDDLDGAPISGMSANACGTPNNGDTTNEKIYCVGPK